VVLDEVSAIELGIIWLDVWLSREERLQVKALLSGDAQSQAKTTVTSMTKRTPATMKIVSSRLSAPLARSFQLTG
jgi:hypothetical protein